jgi:hypothetical protein
MFLYVICLCHEYGVELTTTEFYTFHVLCINQMYTFFLKRPTNAIECMNIILLHRNYRHLSATCTHLQGGKNKNTFTNHYVLESMHS